MATQDLKINFSHISRIKELYRNNAGKPFKDPLSQYYANNPQQAYDERFYGVKINYTHFGRVLCARTLGNTGNTSLQGTVNPQLPIKEPTLWQKILAEVKFRLRQVGSAENPYYKTNTFKRKFVR